MAEQPRSVIIDPAVLAERRARRAAEPGRGAAPPPQPDHPTFHAPNGRGAAPPPHPDHPTFQGPAPSGDAPPWTAPPRAPGRLVAAEHLWRERREALEREL